MPHTTIPTITLTQKDVDLVMMPSTVYLQSGQTNSTHPHFTHLDVDMIMMPSTYKNSYTGEEESKVPQILDWWMYSTAITNQTLPKKKVFTKLTKFAHFISKHREQARINLVVKK
ncbi:unnamed protein product [Pylaiella littoralis]